MYFNWKNTYIFCGLCIVDRHASNSRLIKWSCLEILGRTDSLFYNRWINALILAI